MRSTGFLFAAATALLSLAAATPLARRYEECRAPQQWHVCGDGWAGCCSVSPCKGPAVRSGCPDEAGTPTGDTAPSASATPGPDTEWFKDDFCKEDDSNCNWNATYYMVKNYDENYATNSTKQLFAWKDEGDSKRRDAIAVWKDIPSTAKNCSLAWYKPEKGIFYGTYSDGSFNISLLDTGDKTFEEAADGEISWKNTKKLFETEKRNGVLDLGNWGWSTKARYLDNGEDFDCEGKSEVVVHLALSSRFEGGVIVDQASKVGQLNSFVQRAGWVLRYV